VLQKALLSPEILISKEIIAEENRFFLNANMRLFQSSKSRFKIIFLV
jgi:hypothetical protein